MIEYRIGDVFERLAEIPDDSIDLIVTSPPFLALRSYLPADHPDKAREIGSEATPADFLDTLLELTAEWQRVLAPHGSLCVELGDTYTGAGGYGSPDSPNPAYGKTSHNERFEGRTTKRFKRKDDGWPLAKSKTMIDTLYPACLSYGRNLLNGNPAPQLRIRNLIVWARPNPPVGALGDKFRPATSYITVASMGPKRYFNLDAVRTENPRVDEDPGGYRMVGGEPTHDAGPRTQNPAGAPPLDWHADDHPEDGDWLWKLSTQPYKGSHYATFPMALPKRLIEAMCPRWVCPQCGPVYLHHDQTGSTHQAVRGMRADVPRGGVEDAGGAEGDQRSTVLQPDMLKPPHSPDQGHDEGVRHHQEGISDPVSTGSPNVAAHGLRDGAPLSDGRAPGTQPDARRGGAPHQRGQAGQPDREPRATPQEHARFTAEAGPGTAPVPLVWKPHSDTPQCPTCEGPTRVGRVLDPFGGSGTTLEAAQAVGRHGIAIDLDERNAELARERVGMFLEVVA